MIRYLVCVTRKGYNDFFVLAVEGRELGQEAVLFLKTRRKGTLFFSCADMRKHATERKYHGNLIWR